ncbi:hypothetical protein ONS95_009289 [Cadophora gregata]|uniref:uncharacterized protein n=1 Tax=Cadophora gregata TaxID=51156 RepID=UPI0026DC1EBE|nr:uncharacterized protein ONS95_009289 [Cadophora gregata]KAK0124318.1 hypothetical protein ONS95_009289 [Cadophora gregata]KAK0129828.1 hypothetical protein ONS96_000377 [Cadophora gregata f. sp. sojae]
MGRTSKFSFPIPGRKHKEVTPLHAPSASESSNLSKAQRILGTTNNLNIDISPIREEGQQHQQWKHPGSRSSGMSISISDSTHSSESVHELQNEQWEHESGVLPKSMSEKASSTLLGRRYGEDGTTTTASVRSRRLRSEDSSSTLKSFYDRQKIPLAISQQTSASSARDLALRKGCPPVVQRSPLLQIETSLDPFDEHFGAKNEHNDTGHQISLSPERKKKPGRLDLTKLFPKSRRHGEKSDSDYMTPSPSSASTNGSHNRGSLIPESARRKLKKSQSKESMQSQKFSIRSERSHEQRQTNGTLLQLYDHYENLPVRSPRMDRIPESSVPDRITSGRDSALARMDSDLNSAKRSPDPLSSSSGKEPFSWKNVRSSMAAANLTPSSLTPPNSNWESTSAASISSRNTRTSKTTAGSSFSHSDLQEKSVLSLSSDSEDDSETDPGSTIGPPTKGKSSGGSSGSSPPSTSQVPKSTQPSGGLTVRNYGQRRSTTQHTPYLTVPESSTGTSRLSGPWTPPPQLATPPSSSHQRHSQLPSPREKKDRSLSIRSGTSSRQAKAPSIASIQSLQTPHTPPLSPSSMIFRQTSDRSSRFMAVTEQEEALLEALRQKRARMREEIIEEHETTMKTPPRELESQPSRLSSVTARSSASTLRPTRGADKKQTILLYLDTPLASSQSIDTAEPSPDLDDFLNFGSDEDPTPRTSWAPTRKGRPRPDSFVAPLQRQDTVSSLAPPSAARLSAVGSARGFKPERSSGVGASKKRNTGVRFVDDNSVANSDDFLADDEPMLWNV